MPAEAVKQSPQALSGFTGRKASVAGLKGFLLKLQGSTLEVQEKPADWRVFEVDGTLGGGVKSVDIERNTKGESIQPGQP